MRAIELAIIDYYYLAVRMSRSGSLRDHVLDLRFVDRPLRASERVSWKWILMTLALVNVAAGGCWWLDRLPLCAAALGLMVSGGLGCVWWAAGTVSLRSLHGDATLLAFTGAPGGRRAGRVFSRKLAAHIRLAAAARKRTRAEHLRDEMREHFRLKEAGVLSQEQYDVSKARILAEHAPVRQAAPAPSRGEPQPRAPNRRGG